MRQKLGIENITGQGSVVHGFWVFSGFERGRGDNGNTAVTAGNPQ